MTSWAVESLSGSPGAGGFGACAATRSRASGSPARLARWRSRARLRSCTRLGAAGSGGVVTAAFLPRCPGSARVGRKEGAYVRRGSTGWARPCPRTGRGPDRARVSVDDRLAPPERVELGVEAVQGALLLRRSAPREQPRP